MQKVVSTLKASMPLKQSDITIDNIKEKENYLLMNNKFSSNSNKKHININNSENNSSNLVFQVTNWYQKAAKNKNNIMLFILLSLFLLLMLLGFLYYKGEEKITENGDISAKYHAKYLKKAFYGDTSAQYNIALLYENGEGTEKNLEKAFIGIKKQQKMEILEHNIIWHYYMKMVKEQKKI